MSEDRREVGERKKHLFSDLSSDEVIAMKITAAIIRVIYFKINDANVRKVTDAADQWHVQQELIRTSSARYTIPC